MDTTILAAIIGAGSATITSLPIAFLSYRLASNKAKSEMQLTQQIDAVLLEMLKSEKWDARPLDHIRKVLSGISDGDLRMALLKVGAVRVGDREGQEMWSLRKRRDGPAPRFLMMAG